MSGKRGRKVKTQKRYYGCEDVLISEKVYGAAEEMARRTGRLVEEVIADALKDFLAKFSVSF